MGLKNYRADVSWELTNKVVILEVDENEHQNYNIECEQERIHQLHEVYKKPLLMFRYNPDHCWVKMGKRKWNADGAERHAWLISQLNIILKGNLDNLDKCIVVRGSDEIKVLYAGYTEDRINELWEWIDEQYNQNK